MSCRLIQCLWELELAGRLKLKRTLIGSYWIILDIGSNWQMTAIFESKIAIFVRRPRSPHLFPHFEQPTLAAHTRCTGESRNHRKSDPSDLWLLHWTLLKTLVNMLCELYWIVLNCIELYVVICFAGDLSELLWQAGSGRSAGSGGSGHCLVAHGSSLNSCVKSLCHLCQQELEKRLKFCFLAFLGMQNLVKFEVLFLSVRANSLSKFLSVSISP